MKNIVITDDARVRLKGSDVIKVTNEAKKIDTKSKTGVIFNRFVYRILNNTIFIF